MGFEAFGRPAGLLPRFIIRGEELDWAGGGFNTAAAAKNGTYAGIGGKGASGGGEDDTEAGGGDGADVVDLGLVVDVGEGVDT